MTSAESNLVAELRAARPSADEALRERVRAIAAAGTGRRSLLPRLSLRRLLLVAAPAAVAVAGVAGLLDAGAPSPRVASEAGRQQTRDGTALAPPRGGPGPVAKADAASTDATVPAPAPGRAQRYSAQLTVEVKDVDALAAATRRALQVTRDLGGYLVTVSTATSTTGTSALTVRVPTARVQDAIVQLSGLGKIVAQQVQIDDLQGQLDELTKRESALRERIARLSARLAGPGADAETRAGLEARRDAARSELAQVRTQRAQVAAEARFATVQLSLQTERDAALPPVPSRLDRALDKAAEILAWEASAVLYALLVLGPLALVVLAVWLIRRGLRRREDEQLLSAG